MEPPRRRRPVGLPSARQAFSLVDVERYDPVLATSPRGCAAESEAASPSETAERPDRLRVEASPWAKRPARSRMPPMGIAARADVDIYRYSQAVEQRMRIRPLFESRHELEAAAVTAGTAQQRGEETEANSKEDDLHAHTDRLSEELELDQERYPALDLHDGKEESETRASNHDTDICLIGKEDALSDVVNEDDTTQLQQQNWFDGCTIVAPPMTLTLSNCHEPFIDTEFSLIDAVRFATRLPSNRVKTASSDIAPKEYKIIWNGSCAVGEHQPDVALILNPEGNISVACGDINDKDTVVIILSEEELAQAKQLCGDLIVMSDEWAGWLASRVLQREDGSFHIDLGETVEQQEDVQQKLFSKALVLDPRNADSETQNRVVCIEVFLCRPNEGITVCVEDRNSKTTSQLHLNSEEIIGLASSMGLLQANSSDENLMQQEQSASVLASSDAFFEGLCQSAIIRLAIETLGSSSFDESVRDHDDDHEPYSESAYVTLRQIGSSENSLATDSDGRSDAPHFNHSLASISLLAKAHADDRINSAIRALSQRAAIQMYTKGYIVRAKNAEVGDVSFQESVGKLMEAARTDRLHRLAYASIVDDLVVELLRAESRCTLHETKYSAEFRDHFATKLQATFRMRKQRGIFRMLQHKRMVAARIIQARHRGIMARHCYRALQLQDEQFQLYGFIETKPQMRRLYKDRVHLATAGDAAHRVRFLELEDERRRVGLFMHILYSSSPGKPNITSVQSVLAKFGILAGHPSGLDEEVMHLLRDMANSDTSEPPDLLLLSRNQISVALMLALRLRNRPSPWDISAAKKNEGRHSSQTALQASLSFGSEHYPPRWALKANIAVRRANRERLDQLRLTCHQAAIEAAQPIAACYRQFLGELVVDFEESRRLWEASIVADERRSRDAHDTEKLTQRCLDLLLLSVKDSGVDPERLLEALNFCYASSGGKQAVAIAEQEFNRLVSGMVADCEYPAVLPLRKEIEQELGNVDRLLALRCLDVAAHGEDYYHLVPASALLHLVLWGEVMDWQVRLVLPAILPIADVADKYELAKRIVRVYAGPEYGEALNEVCWSCMGSSETVSADAGRLADLLIRLSFQDDAQSATRELSEGRTEQDETVASRALQLLTGVQSVRFLQFLAQAAHAAPALQRRVRLLLAPLSAESEVVRIASAVSHLASAREARALFARRFSRGAVGTSADFWVQFRALFGLERARESRACVSATCISLA